MLNSNLVLWHPRGEDEAPGGTRGCDQPYAAIVVRTNEDGTVNLVVFSHVGDQFVRKNVPLGQPAETGVSYCEKGGDQWKGETSTKAQTTPATPPQYSTGPHGWGGNPGSTSSPGGAGIGTVGGERSNEAGAVGTAAASPPLPSGAGTSATGAGESGGGGSSGDAGQAPSASSQDTPTSTIESPAAPLSTP